MNASQRLIIVSEHYAPSTAATGQLIDDLSCALANLSIQTVVITATPGPSVHNGIPVIRTSILSVGQLRKTGILFKAVTGSAFFVETLIWLFLHSSSRDQLLLVSNPPFIGIIGILAKYLKRVQYTFLFQDLFPHSAQLAGILPSQGPLIAIFNLLQKLVCYESKSTVVLSEDMREKVRRSYAAKAAINVIHNWAPLNHNISKRSPANPYSSQRSTNINLCLLYSGNFGRLHDILIVLEAARLTTQHSIHYHFVGGGSKSRLIHDYITKLSMSNVFQEGYVSRADLSLSLQDCHLAVVSLLSGAEHIAAPSKLYGILSVGRPVLLIANKNSKIAQSVIAHKFGFVVSPGDPESLARLLIYLSTNAQILKTYGENARNYYLKNFGLEKSAKLYIDALGLSNKS